MTAELLHGFYLGDLLVEPARGQVTGRAGVVHLAPKAMEVLLCLVASPGELVPREELLNKVWGAGRGSQEALGHAVSQIRQALGDHFDSPRYVQTLPRRGYRLLVTPEIVAETTSSVVLGAEHGARVSDIGFLENLRQRGVLEAAVAYLIVGWLLIQVADIVFDRLHLPDWAATFVTVLVLAGFPIALVLSWYLEFRDGRAVLHELSAADARKRRFSRTYLSVIGGLAIAALLVYGYDRSVGLPEAPPAELSFDASAALPPIQENSIAVLPFLALDPSEKTRIFSNGIAEDIITSLSHVPGLLVASRGDSFTLEPNSPSARVRERLRVAKYVEGSIQIDGDLMRVVVQLVNSETGFHVVSRTFDRALGDYFKLRDEITELTVANVRVALPSSTRAELTIASENPSLDAYVLYRRGVEAARRPTADANVEAIGWYDAALEIDPDFAAAYAGKCTANVRDYTESRDTRLIDKAESSCARAQELNPNLDVVHTSLGNLYSINGRYERALDEYQQALRVDPNDAGALFGMGGVYNLLNEADKAEASLRHAIGLRPGDWAAYNALGAFLFNSGRYLEAAEQYEFVVAMDRFNMTGYSNLGTAYMLAGNFDKAKPALQTAIDIEPKTGTYASLGLLYYYLGRLDDAIDAHRRAIQLAPMEYLPWSNLGDALWIARRTDEAQDAFRNAEKLATDALQVNPNDPYAQMDLAWINAMLGHQDAARKLMDSALSSAADDPYANYIDGLVRLRAGNVDAALDSLETAAKKGYPVKIMAAEPHLASLRSNRRFSRLLEAAESR